ncbi:unnamed protein product, partial [Sphacelaria rigidula]
MDSAKVAPPSTIVVGDEAKTRFLDWARLQDDIEFCPDIDMFHQFREGYRGVVATKDIQADVALVRVARRCCIGPETTDVSKDDWKKAMASAEDATPATDKFGNTLTVAPRLTRACFTVLSLLHEKGLGEASPFHAYLSVLPRDHRLPMEWNEAELDLLEGTSAEPLVRRGSLDSQFQKFERIVKLHPTLWEPSVCTKAQFAKGVNWVRSRGFTVMGDPHMIPGADMFNHDPDKQSVQMSTDGEDHFVMKTVHPVKAGDEIFSSFGNLSNAQLLNSYGFVLPGNPFDNVVIPTKLVVSVCHNTFVKLEGSKMKKAEAKATWERRLAMVDSNDDVEETQEAFVISKYDLLPESLIDRVQILTMSSDEEVAYAAIAAIAQAKAREYRCIRGVGGGGSEPINGGNNPVGEGQGVGVDAESLAGMLVNEEKTVLNDLRMQLMSEV